MLLSFTVPLPCKQRNERHARPILLLFSLFSLPDLTECLVKTLPKLTALWDPIP